MFHSQNLLSFGLYFSALSSLMFCGKYVGSFQPLPATFFQSGTTFSQSRIFVAFILTISIFRSMSLISWTMSFISLAASSADWHRHCLCANHCHCINEVIRCPGGLSCWYSLRSSISVRNTSHCRLFA